MNELYLSNIATHLKEIADNLDNLLSISDSLEVIDDRLNDLKEQHQEMFGLYKSQIDADFQNYKFSRDSYDAILAKQNNDAFALFQGYTNKTQMLQSEIDELKTKLAVADAVRPYLSPRGNPGTFSV